MYVQYNTTTLQAYGIFHSYIYLQSLLRDRLFRIRTDHRNLLFIKEASNPIIVRWYMALSEFSFTLEFIPGVDNDIADEMSRLGRNNMVDSPQEYSEEHILSTNSASIKLNESQMAKIGRMHNSKFGHFGFERTLKCLKDREDV